MSTTINDLAPYYKPGMSMQDALQAKLAAEQPPIAAQTDATPVSQDIVNARQAKFNSLYPDIAGPLSDKYGGLPTTPPSLSQVESQQVNPEDPNRSLVQKLRYAANEADPSNTTIDEGAGIKQGQEVPYYLAKDVTPRATANPWLDKMLMSGVTFPKEEETPVAPPPEASTPDDKAALNPPADTSPPLPSTVKESEPAAEGESKEKIDAIAEGKNTNYQDIYSQSREKANRLLGFAAFQESAAAALGRPANTTAIRQEAQDELARGDEAIRADRSTIDHEKAAIELRSEEAQANPDSAISKLGRNLYTQMTGQKPSEDMTYASLVKTQGMIGKYVASQAMLQARKYTADAQAIKMQHSQEQQLNKFYDTQGPQYAKALNSSMASSRSQLGAHARNINMADRMMDQFGDKDPNSLNKQQIATLTSDYVSMMTGGQPTAAAIQKMFPETGAGKIADVVQFVTGDPTGRRQGQFVKQMLNGTQSLRQQSYNRIKQNMDVATAGFAGYTRARPEDAKAAMDAAIKQVSPSDVSAPSTDGLVKVRSKTSGTTKALRPEDAAKYLKDPNYEQVQ